MNARAWLENAVDYIEHAVWIGGSAFIGAVVTYLLHYLQMTNPLSVIADLQTKAGITSLLVGAIGAGLTSALSTIKMPSNAMARLAAKSAGGNSTGRGPGSTPSGDSAFRRSVLPPLAPPFRLVVALVCLFAACAVALTGCLTSAPIVIQTPSNQAQIASCQSTASLHNGVVIGDFVVTGSAAGLAGASAFVTDTTAKNTMAITGAGLGGAALIGTGIAALAASNFANSKCSDVVGNLPTATEQPDGGPTPPLPRADRAPQGVLP